LPLLGGVWGKAGVLKKQDVERRMKIGDGGDAFGKLADGVVEGGGVGGSGERGDEESEKKTEKKTRRAKEKADLK